MNNTTKTLFTGAALTAGAFTLGTQQASADTVNAQATPTNATQGDNATAQAQSNKSQADQKVADAQKQTDTAQKDYDQAAKNRQDDQNQYDSLNKQIAQVEDDVNNQPEHLQESQAKINKYNDTIDQNTNDLKTAQSKVDADNDAVVKANDALNNANANVTKAQDDANTKQKTVNDLANNDINKTIANQTADVNGKQTALTNAQTAQKQAQENVDKSQSTLTTIQGLINNKDKTIADAQKSAQDAQNTLNQANTSLAQAQSDLQTKQAALAPIQAKQSDLVAKQQATAKTDAIRASFYKQMNAYRVANGVQPLEQNAELDALADSRAQAVSDGKLDKTSASSVHGGRTLAITNTLDNQNYVVESTGENETSLTAYYNTMDADAIAKRLLDSWIASPEHKLTLLMSNFNTSGFGISIAPAEAMYGNQLWVTSYQEFAQTNGKSDTSLSDDIKAYAKIGQDLLNGWTKYPVVETSAQANQAVSDNLSAYTIAQQAVTSAQATLTQAQGNFNNAQKANNQAQSNLKTVQDDAQSAAQKLQDAQNALHNAQAQLVTANTDAVTASNALTLAQNTLASTKANAGNQADLMAKAQTDLDNANKALSQVQNKQSQAQADLDNAKKIQSNDKQELDKLNQSIADTKTKLADETKRRDYLADPVALENHLYDLQKQALDLSMKLITDDAAVSKAHDTLVDAQNTLEDAKAEQTKAQNDLDNAPVISNGSSSYNFGNGISANFAMPTETRIGLPGTAKESASGTPNFGWFGLLAFFSALMALTKKNRFKTLIDDFNYKPQH